MRRKKTETIIRVPVNHGFYGLPINNLAANICNEWEPASQKALGKLIKGEHSSLIISDEDGFNKEGYYNVNTISFRKKEAFSEPKVVYEVRKADGQYYLTTGLYIGTISVDGVGLEINPGYPKCFLRRMLNVANNIFFDFSAQQNVRDDNEDNMLSIILGEIFLTSFKASFAMGLPSKYQRFEERGMNIKGKINLSKYLFHDMLLDYQVPYSYVQRVFSQDIIDVLFLAMKCLDSGKETQGMMVNSKYYRQLKQLYSGRRVRRSTLKKINKDKSLNNPMYTKYRTTLKYAQYILEHKSLIYEDDSERDYAPGFLLDISELWEVYLAKLIENYFTNYSVKSQSRLDLYSGTFFARSYYPDIVMESDKGIVVIDAKYKKMDFRNLDVDRNDLHQMHSYAGYFQIESHKPVKLCSLIYPATQDIEPQKTIDRIYGIDNADTRFSVGYIKVGNTYKEMIQNERAFLKRLERSIG